MVNALAFTPREIARDSPSVLWVVTVACASLELAEPSLITVTSASTSRRVLVGIAMDELETLSCPARSAVATVGGAKLVLDEVLASSCVTVKLTSVASARARRALVALGVKSGTTVQLATASPPAQMVASRALAICSALTPCGRLVLIALFCVSTTCTCCSSAPPPVALEPPLDPVLAPPLLATPSASTEGRSSAFLIW